MARCYEAAPPCAGWLSHPLLLYLELVLDSVLSVSHPDQSHMCALRWIFACVSESECVSACGCIFVLFVGKTKCKYMSDIVSLVVSLFDNYMLVQNHFSEFIFSFSFFYFKSIIDSFSQLCGTWSKKTALKTFCDNLIMENLRLLVRRGKICVRVYVCVFACMCVYMLLGYLKLYESQSRL